MAYEFGTTKMTTKGQVVIPQEIREKLHLEPGTKFVVVGEEEEVVLKKIEPRFEKLEEIRKMAQKNPRVRELSKLPENERMKEINKIVHSVRK